MYLAIGLAIGLLLGLTGAGGSVLAVPLLILFSPLTVADAMGLALGTVFCAAIYGSILQWHNFPAFGRPVVAFILGGLFTAPLGRWASYYLPETLLVTAFATLATAIAIWTWIHAEVPSKKYVRDGIEGQGNHCTQTHNQQTIARSYDTNLPQCILYSLGVGFVSGLLGVGGGFLIVPVLIHRLAMPPALAVSASITIIAVFSGAGFTTHLFIANDQHLVALAYLIIGSISGMFCSQCLRNHLQGAALQRLFAVILLATTAITTISRSL